LRPSHVIRPDEVDAWLADSTVRTVTYHRTSAAAARSILERGPSVERSRIGMYGQGFYSSTMPDPFYGEAEVAVAVRLRRAFVGTVEEVDALIDPLVRRFDPRQGRLSPSVAASIRRALVAAGYDGLVVWDGLGDSNDLVVTLDDRAIRVIRDDA
jgi:hypothetical protein